MKMKKEIIIIAMALTIMPGLVSAIMFLSPNPYHIGNAYPGDTGYYNLTLFNEYFKNVTINLIVNSSSGNLTCDFNGNSTTDITIPTLGTAYPKVNYSVSPAAYPGDHSCYVQIYVPDLIPPYIYLLNPPNGSTIRAGTLINLTVTDNINVSNVWYTKSIFYDTFSASSGTATDNPWTFSDGTWSVVNGQLTQNGSITQTYAFAGNTSWTNYILESRLKANSSNADTYVGVNFRVQSDNRSYWVGIHNDNSIEMWRLDAYPGSWTQLADWSGYNFDFSWHTIKVRAIGSNFDVYWDENYVNTTTDGTYPSGKIGLHTSYSTNVDARFDDVKVSSVESTLFSGSVNFTQVSIDTTSWPDGLTLLDAYANDTSNNLNHTVYLFTIDNTPPTVENSTLNKTVNLGDDVTVFVDAFDPSNVSSVIVEDYSEFLRFDFQPDSSPVQKDYIKVNRTMLYPFTANGTTFGWDASVFDDRDRGIGTRLTRDFVFDSANREFKVDLPNGNYNVNIFIGDMSYSHDMIDVFAEGQLKLANLNNTAGTVNVYDFIVNVNDGQLNIAMHEGGGTDPYWVLNGLVIKSLNKSYVMSHLSGNTYSTTILTPNQGFHSIRYVANDTFGNTNDMVIDSFYVNVKPTLTNISSNATCVKQNSPINITTYNALDLNGDDLILRVSSAPKTYDLCNSSAGQPEVSCLFNTIWNDTVSHAVYGLVDDGFIVSEEKSVTIYSDNSGPNSPTGLSPVNNSLTNSNPTFSWSIPSDVGCNGTINGYNISVYTDSNCTILYKNASPTSNSYTFPDSFSSGTYYWRVKASDGLNNWGTWSGCMKLNIDAIPPRVENSSIINKTVDVGDNVTVLVDIWDENGVDKVILENYIDKYRFDFGTDTSPVEAGYTQITRFMLKNNTNDYGWFTSPSGDTNRSTGIPPLNLTRDLIFDSVDRTFLINLTNGKYLVTPIMGDMDYSHDNMDVYAQGQLKLNKINTSATEIKWLNFTTTVNNGQLNITFHDYTGPDLNWVCNGLIIRSLAGTYNMNKLVNNTYKVVIPNLLINNYTVLYFANDTLGNINNTVTDFFSVIKPPKAKITYISIYPSLFFNDTIYVGPGKTQFNITFDRNMNTSVQPTVKFGLTPIIIDDGDTGYSTIGGWIPYTGQGYGNDVQYISAGTGLNNATWTPNLTATGFYNVYVSWTTHPNRATNANYTIYYSGGSYSFTVNQENYANNTTGGSSGEWSGWYYAGTFNFSSGMNGKVVLNDNANEYVIADAVKFESTINNFITGSWINSKLWSGSYIITSSTLTGNNTLNITGAKDLVGNTVDENTSTTFIIYSTAPKFVTVIISPSVANTYVKSGNVSFTIIFNQNMDNSTNPVVTFGVSQPYNTYVINGNWVNNTTWVGYYYFSPTFPNHWYVLSISAKDLFGRDVKDTSYMFFVDTRVPIIWDILTSNITIEDNETISAKVKDYKPIGEESSGISSVIVELNSSANFTMKLGFVDTYGNPVYYIILNNTSYTSGNQSLKFYVSDTAGNINTNATASFYVNSTIPKIGGKIAFLCRYAVNNTCSDGIESTLIFWLRKQGWNVTVKTYYGWNKTNLLGYDLMMCSDESYACDYGTKSTTDVYYMHKNYKIPFVEISDDSSLGAAKNFGYATYPGGYTENNVNSLYVTISHPITTGYFGYTQIFNTNRTMASITDITLSGVKDIADAGYEDGRSTLFSNDQPGRFVYIGWFYDGFNGLNLIGNTTLSRAINWAQCGNAKGCNSTSILPPTTTTTSLSTITTTSGSTSTTSSSATTIPLTCDNACKSNGYSSGTCKLSCSFSQKQLSGTYCPPYLYWTMKCCCTS